MRYNSTINNIKSNEWGLTIQEAYLFSWFYELPSWASKIVIDNEIYFFASRLKAIEELPILTDKIDTMYRYYKKIELLNLIVLKKIDGKDYICLTKKGKQWNSFKSEESEKNPKTVGKKSENSRKKIRKQSEKNPTDNNINNNTTIDNKTIDKEKSKIEISHLPASDSKKEISEEELLKKQEEERRKKVAPKKEEIEPQKIIDIFNSTCKNLPRALKVTQGRKKAIKARLKDSGISEIVDVFNKVAQSNFLNGHNDRNWTADFDWILNPTNYQKILEGKYSVKTTPAPVVGKINLINTNR